MQKVIRTGNSLAVVVPYHFAQMIGVKSGDKVEVISKPENGKLVIVFSGSNQLPLGLSSKKS